jgi:DNA repair exonuclease SbcCD ATPase subunit
MHASEDLEMKKPSMKLARTLLLACCAGFCALGAAQAQAQDAKVSKEREALRRSQTALKAAQEQQSSLQAEKVKLEQDKNLAEQDAGKAKAQASSQAAKLKSMEQQTQKLQADLQAAEATKLALESAAGAREKELQQQLLAARRESAERQQAVQVTARLLERSTLALQDAEAKNRKLHSIGEEAIKRYLSRKPSEITGIGDPLFGLNDIRLENVAEELRSQMDAQRVVTSAQAGSK